MSDHTETNPPIHGSTTVLNATVNGASVPTHSQYRTKKVLQNQPEELKLEKSAQKILDLVGDGILYTSQEENEFVVMASLRLSGRNSKSQTSSSMLGGMFRRGQSSTELDVIAHSTNTFTGPGPDESEISDNLENDYDGSANLKKKSNSNTHKGSSEDAFPLELHSFHYYSTYIADLVHPHYESFLAFVFFILTMIFYLMYFETARHLRKILPWMRLTGNIQVSGLCKDKFTSTDLWFGGGGLRNETYTTRISGSLVAMSYYCREAYLPEKTIIPMESWLEWNRDGSWMENGREGWNEKVGYYSDIKNNFKGFQYFEELDEVINAQEVTVTSITSTNAGNADLANSKTYDQLIVIPKSYFHSRDIPNDLPGISDIDSLSTELLHAFTTLIFEEILWHLLVWFLVALLVDLPRDFYRKIYKLQDSSSTEDPENSTKPKVTVSFFQRSIGSLSFIKSLKSHYVFYFRIGIHVFSNIILPLFWTTQYSWDPDHINLNEYFYQFMNAKEKTGHLKKGNFAMGDSKMFISEFLNFGFNTRWMFWLFFWRFLWSTGDYLGEYSGGASKHLCRLRRIAMVNDFVGNSVIQWINLLGGPFLDTMYTFGL